MVSQINSISNAIPPCLPTEVTQLFKLRSTEPNDKVGGTFWQGFMSLARDSQKSHVKLPKTELVRNVLNAQFGHSLVDRVFKRYKIDDSKTLTVADYQALLHGIAAGVSRVELAAHFDELKGRGEFPECHSFDDADSAILSKVWKHFTGPAKELMAIKEKQAESTASKVLKAVAAVFLTLCCLALIAIGVLAFTVAFPLSAGLAAAAIAVGVVGLGAITAAVVCANRKNVKPPYHNELKDDNDFLKTCFLVNKFKFNPDQNIAASEYLAHDLVYDELQEGQIVPIKETGQLMFAEVRKRIDKDGLVCFLLTPLLANQHLDNFPIWELYRGTHDMKSLRRLGEPNSAGHYSFKHHEKIIFESLADVIPPDAKAVTLKKRGHSLGGADVQRSTAATVAYKADIIAAKTLKDRHYPDASEKIKKRVHTISFPGPDLIKIAPAMEKIRKIEAHIWNSAGIASITNDRFKHDAKYINDLNHVKTDERCDIQITECKVGGDIVQKTGQTTLGHGMKPDDAKVFRSVYHFKHGFEGVRGFFKHFGLLAKAKAHQIKNLNRKTNGGKDPVFTYADSKTDFDAVEKESGDHFTWVGEKFEKIKWSVTSTLFGHALFINNKPYSPIGLS